MCFTQIWPDLHIRCLHCKISTHAELALLCMNLLNNLAIYY